MSASGSIVSTVLQKETEEQFSKLERGLLSINPNFFREQKNNDQILLGFKRLFPTGAKPEVLSNFFCLCQHRNAKFYEQILENSFDKEDQYQRTVLHYIASSPELIAYAEDRNDCQKSSIEFVINFAKTKGVEHRLINGLDSNGRSPLYYMLEKKPYNIECIKWMIEEGAKSYSLTESGLNEVSVILNNYQKSSQDNWGQNQKIESLYLLFFAICKDFEVFDEDKIRIQNIPYKDIVDMIKQHHKSLGRTLVNKIAKLESKFGGVEPISLCGMAAKMGDAKSLEELRLCGVGFDKSPEELGGLLDIARENNDADSPIVEYLNGLMLQEIAPDEEGEREAEPVVPDFGGAVGVVGFEGGDRRIEALEEEVALPPVNLVVVAPNSGGAVGIVGGNIPAYDDSSDNSSELDTSDEESDYKNPVKRKKAEDGKGVAAAGPSSVDNVIEHRTLSSSKKRERYQE